MISSVTVAGDVGSVSGASIFVGVFSVRGTSGGECNAPTVSAGMKDCYAWGNDTHQCRLAQLRGWHRDRCGRRVRTVRNFRLE